MLGAIAGDIIGSKHEFLRTPTKTVDFGPLFPTDCEFTDDTILTIATAEVILERRPTETPHHRDAYLKYGEAYLKWGRNYPSSYGSNFQNWLYKDRPEPYNSFGNGSAMRVSPIGWAFPDLDETLKQAEFSALPTHNHPEGIKGAASVAHAIFLARNGANKLQIRQAIENDYGYDLQRSINQIRPSYRFDVTCQGTVPEAIIAFLESEDYESAVRIAISLGGDADTLACITGSIAEPFYGGVPDEIVRKSRAIIPTEMISVVDQFLARFS